jgi:hypothetical protein
VDSGLAEVAAAPEDAAEPVEADTLLVVSAVEAGAVATGSYIAAALAVSAAASAATVGDAAESASPSASAAVGAVSSSAISVRPSAEDDETAAA